MSQEVARGNLKQMQHQKICRPYFMKSNDGNRINTFITI